MQALEILQVALKDEASTLALIPHAESVRAQTLHVPVGDVRDVGVVETGTVVVILVVFVYLVRTIVWATRAQGVAVAVAASKKDR
jgi:PIG-X/PBN1 protein